MAMPVAAGYTGGGGAGVASRQIEATGTAKLHLSTSASELLLRMRMGRICYAMRVSWIGHAMRVGWIDHAVHMSWISHAVGVHRHFRRAERHVLHAAHRTQHRPADAGAAGRDAVGG